MSQTAERQRWQFYRKLWVSEVFGDKQLEPVFQENKKSESGVRSAKHTEEMQQLAITAVAVLYIFVL